MSNLNDHAELEPERLGSILDRQGYAIVPGYLGQSDCQSLAAMFDVPHHFRSTVVMARHTYGEGSYKYFAAPVPNQIAAFRSELYDVLLSTARRWQHQLRSTITYPDTHEAFLRDCASAGQLRPTPLLLDYGPGGHNRLHQDQYGDVSFPLQAVVMLSDADDFDGGAFVLVEQRPRQQSRARVIMLNQGDMLVFANNHRPGEGTRGHYRITVRHGVADITSGHRRTLGLILHDAV